MATVNAPLSSSQKTSRYATRREINSADGSTVAYTSLGSKLQKGFLCIWSWGVNRAPLCESLFFWTTCNIAKFSSQISLSSCTNKMAGLSSSTTKRGGRNLGQQASSNEMAEVLRAWDDEEDELVDFIRTSNANSENLSSASSRNTTGSETVVKYSPSSVRKAKTFCLFVRFFGLVRISYSCLHI